MNTLTEKLDRHFNISGKYSDKGIEFMAGIRAIMCGVYKGGNVCAAIVKDALSLENALINGDIARIQYINKKYFKSWNKNQTNHTRCYVRPDLASGELFTKTLAVLIFIDSLAIPV